ncbi:MAG TPA: CHAP domain-containing protein, partial [Solirubrobacteraceae bacterium]|nr:CHAP domain-containing protein [Solirubrobacteraceae bacterium]
ELQSLLQPKPVQAPAPTPGSLFQGTLQSAQAGLAPGMAATGPVQVAQPVAPGGTAAGQAIVNLVRGEVGQAEQPPGSNDSPRIAQYRQATAGSGVGPWCAYFVSWAAREVGVPIGDSGQGYGLVDDVYAWAERTGKAIPAGSGTPQPGDLIVWDEHIGIVEAVRPDGTIQTIEGNSSDQVARRTYDAGGGGAIGFVRLG